MNSNTSSTRRFSNLAAAALLLLATGAQAGPTVVKAGEFSGLSDHVTTGGVQIVRDANGLTVTLAENFSLDGAPDAKVGFGKGGVYDVSTQLAPLASNTGKQSYTVPASVKIDQYDEVYIWCEQFAVPLGVAKIR